MGNSKKRRDSTMQKMSGVFPQCVKCDKSHEIGKCDLSNIDINEREKIFCVLCKKYVININTNLSYANVAVNFLVLEWTFYKENQIV